MSVRSKRKLFNQLAKEANAVPEPVNVDDIVYDVADEDGWVGPKHLTEQLLLFADYYINARGINRSFTRAAKEAGANPSTAHIHGSKWAKYSAVKAYWKAHEESFLSLRKSVHIGALLGLEDIAHDKKTDTIVRVEALKVILDKTDKVFNDEIKETKPEDESTVGTVNQVLLSIQALTGGNTDGGASI